MLKTIIYLTTINTFLLTIPSRAQDQDIEITKTSCPALIMPTPLHSTVKTQLLDEEDREFWLDRLSQLPNRPLPPRPIATANYQISDEQDYEDRITNLPFNLQLLSLTSEDVIVTSPLTRSLPSLEKLPSIPKFSTNQSMSASKIRERIMKKNWQLLEEEKPVSLRILTLLKTSASHHALPQEREHYQQYIMEEIDEMY